MCRPLCSKNCLARATQTHNAPENIITNTQHAQHTHQQRHNTQDGTCGTIIETSSQPETYGRTDWVVGYNALIYWYTAFEYGNGGNGRARVGFSRLANKYAIDGFWLSP